MVFGGFFLRCGINSAWQVTEHLQGLPKGIVLRLETLLCFALININIDCNHNGSVEMGTCSWCQRNGRSGWGARPCATGRGWRPGAAPWSPRPRLRCVCKSKRGCCCGGTGGTSQLGKSCPLLYPYSFPVGLGSKCTGPGVRGLVGPPRRGGSVVFKSVRCGASALERAGMWIHVLLCCPVRLQHFRRGGNSSPLAATRE